MANLPLAPTGNGPLAYGLAVGTGSSLWAIVDNAGLGPVVCAAIASLVPITANLVQAYRAARDSAPSFRRDCRMDSPALELEPDAPPLRLAYLDPGELDAHPENWKFHDGPQLEALSDFIGEVGPAGALLFNETTGKLLDGHGRREILKGKPFPVLVGRWSPEQERKILAYLDPTGWMARTNGAALSSLLDGANSLLGTLKEESPRLLELLDAVKASAEAPPVDKPASDAGADQVLDQSAPSRPAAAETPDALWPSDNLWGVPLLDISLQADAVEFPVVLWGTQGQTRAMRGTWVFYTSDSSFEILWANPGKVLPSGAPCLVEPNYSTHDQTPFACALWSIYKRRWLARYWQSQGKRVFVDLNIHHSLLEPHEATGGQIPGLLGVPPGWKAYASRAHANRPAMLEAEYAVACQHAGGPALFLVYGGGKAVRELAMSRGWAWVPEQSDTVRGKDLGGVVEPRKDG